MNDIALVCIFAQHLKRQPRDFLHLCLMRRASEEERAFLHLRWRCKPAVIDEVPAEVVVRSSIVLVGR